MSCNIETKNKVDAMINQIPYPKHSIGDKLFNAFLTVEDEYTPFSEGKPSVNWVRITDMRLSNGLTLCNGEIEYGLLLQNPNTPVWEYQYADACIESPVGGDLSKFYSENRFCTSPDEAIKALKVLQEDSESNADFDLDDLGLDLNDF